MTISLQKDPEWLHFLFLCVCVEQLSFLPVHFCVTVPLGKAWFFFLFQRSLAFRAFGVQTLCCQSASWWHHHDILISFAFFLIDLTEVTTLRAAGGPELSSRFLTADVSSGMTNTAMHRDILVKLLWGLGRLEEEKLCPTPGSCKLGSLHAHPVGGLHQHISCVCKHAMAGALWGAPGSVFHPLTFKGRLLSWVCWDRWVLLRTEGCC